MERSREKSNIPGPSTFNISSQDGERVDWEINQEDSAGCLLHLQPSCSVMETCRKCSAVSAPTKHWRISTQWKVAKEIMESARVFFFFVCFIACTWVDDSHLSAGKMIRTALSFQTLLTALFLCNFKCSVCSKEHFYLSQNCAKQKNNHHCSSMALKIIRLKNTFSKWSCVRNTDPWVTPGSGGLNHSHGCEGTLSHWLAL